MITDFRCSFCGKLRSEVRKLISGPRVFICNECVLLALDVIAEDDGVMVVRDERGVWSIVHLPPEPIGEVKP